MNKPSNCQVTYTSNTVTLTFKEFNRNCIFMKWNLHNELQKSKLNKLEWTKYIYTSLHIIIYCPFVQCLFYAW